MLIMDVFISRTKYLSARFFETFYIQCIFYEKLRSQRLRSIIESLFHRGPRKKGLSAFIYMQFNNLDEEFKR